MDKEGKASIPFLLKGVLDVRKFMETLAFAEVLDMGPSVDVTPSPVANFPDRESADAAALKFGWEVKDVKGPNHRCPECVAREYEERQESHGALVEARRGAYIEF
jgi:hypothetical protein